MLVRQAAKALDEDWDIEVLEMHHRHKVDAPSGTALLLGKAAAEGREVDLAASSVRVRDGHTGARGRGTIGFATLRGGSVVGEHSVIFAGEGERLELSHKAGDRSIFARGAVKAALWARSRKPGLYSMLDVLGLQRIAHPTVFRTRNAIMSGTLVLVRHGQSEWNLKNLFTGWKDPGLTELGIKEAEDGARALKDYGISFDIAFTSALSRAQKTCEIILDIIGQTDLETIRDEALNERDYGDLAGLNKDDARAQVGRGAGAYLAPLLRRSAAGRREPEGHRRARLALLHDRDPAPRAARREGAGRRPRQFAARARHGARPAEPRRDPQAQPGDRRAHGLQAEAGFDRRLKGSALGDMSGAH